MIKALAPLGATHNIVLILAYGEIPKSEGDTPQLGGESIREVTITAHLKPKDGVKGESRSLQFKGPAIDVEAELAEKLPIVVTKIVAHQDALAQLDSQLAAEKEKAEKEADSKKSSPGKPAAAPAGVKSRTVYPNTTKKPEEKKAETKKATPAKAETKKATGKGAAAAALAKLEQAAGTATPSPAVSMANVPAATAAPAPAESDPLAELERLAAQSDTKPAPAAETPTEQVDTAALTTDAVEL